MAEEMKPVEVPKEETAAPVETVPVETKPVEETPAVPAPVEEAKPAEETKPAEAEAEAPKEEAKKEEVKPIEEGYLAHKAQGMSFPKNLIPSKVFFFFGSDAVEPKSLSAYQKSEKSADASHSNMAWASHTGKGLLFMGDKKAPSGLINLSESAEPEAEGSNKFSLTSKGIKHSFKAGSTAERDNWVSQLKLKIAEAKELAPTVTESETYKTTLESFKPAKKEEKPVEAAAATEEPAKTEEEPVKEAEAAKEEPKEETKIEEPKEETKIEEPKKRSSSRKRASFFGFGKKEEAKAETTPEEEPAKEETAPVVEPEVVAAAETEAPKTEETSAATEEAPKEEAAKEEATAEPVKPTPSKRNSIFGSVFSKKEKKTAETPAESTEAAKEPEAVPATEETAPVIPPVEATTPLAVDVSSPATVPTETTEVPAANGEPKKDVKEKRKSSLPFAFGKKSPPPTEGEAKASPFSKLRATIKGKSAGKPEEKTAEETKTEEPLKEEEAKTEEPAAEAAPVEPATIEPEVENKPETVATTTPAVTAAA